MAAPQFHPCPLPVSSRHYLLRDNVMVPLVPVDQLPFQLQGIPRQLSHRQMFEESWKFVDESQDSASSLTLLEPQLANPQTPRHLPPDYDIRRSVSPSAKDYSRPSYTPRVQNTTTASSSANDHTHPSYTSRFPSPSRAVRDPVHEHPSLLTDRFARFEYRVPYPSGIEPDHTRKVYCTHWIKTGECAFTSIGCKFKHEMPCVEKLRELGFVNGTPRWFQEKTAIAARGPTWMQLRMAERTGLQDHADRQNHLPVLRSRSADMHERGAAQGTSPHPSVSKQVSTPPRAPEPTKLAAVPSANEIPDLLIDLDDSSAEDWPPPSSAQYSVCSISSTESDQPKKKLKKTDQDHRTGRYCSPKPFMSESEDEVEATKRLPSRDDAADPKPAATGRLTTAPPSVRQTGLGGSRYSAARRTNIPVAIQNRYITARAPNTYTSSSFSRQQAVGRAPSQPRAAKKTTIPGKRTAV